MSAEQYVVRQDDLMFDLILWRRYGRYGQALIEQALVLNPGVAELGTAVPVGTVLALPPMPPRTTLYTARTVALFG